MEKILKLYTYIDGINDTPFPSEEYQVVTSNFRSDYKRMGGAPSITCTIMHPMCLDKLWTYGVYAKFNGERFFIKQIPSSSYDNTDARYKHELELVSERIILDNVYVYDVVDSTSVDDKPVSNSSKFTFFGTINEFVQRLNQSLRYSGLDYTIVVDEGITSEGKLVSFENQFFSNALHEIYNIFELPYYFVGKVIHVGYTSNAITRTFKYGKDESLLSIQKQNANYKIVNRATGLGSADNIPYYYPNDDEKGETALYYNGELGIATISNPTRFRKVALGDIFKYSKGGSVEEYIIDTNDYALGFVDVQQYYDEQGSIVQGLNKWTIEFKYKFSTDVTRDFSFYINSQYLDTIDVTVHILRENGGFSKTWTNPNMIEQAFNQGDYTLTIVWNLKSDKKSSTTNDTVAREFIDKNFTVQGIISYNNYDGWLLNNTRVLLISYGINVSGSPKDGDMITFERLSYIQPQSNLMPPIYRESAGKDRFYNALNDTYISTQTNDFYEFENPYVEGQPKEHIVTFDSIKPSIVGIRNAENQRIDTFLEFAYDEDDNDETYPEGHAKAGEYIHPYFFAKLRRFNGQFGFNLFDHSIDESEMVISMTSGSCGACEFIIGVTDDTQENIVQVDERGNLLRDKDGNVIRSGTPQERQNNTIDNEVWVALKKDINTFGVIMPNASNKYRPSVEDTFVILHIDLPKAYILAAEERLKDEIIKYMALNNSEKFNFSISFSRIFFAENPDILAQLDENARIQIEYDGTRYELYVSSYSYNMSKEQPLPEIRVELSDTLNVSQNALQNAISEVKRDIMSSVGSMDFLYQGLPYFLRKDVDDRARGKISSDVGFEVGNYVSGASGAIVYKDVETGQTIGEVDKLYVRMKAYFETLEIVNANTIGGKQIISPAGSIKCVGVEDVGDAYRCYFLAEQDGEKINNRWQQYDQAYSQTFNAKEGEHNNVSNTYYWRLVTKASSSAIEFNGKMCHYIELSKTDCDKGSDIPNVGDIINQRGSRTDVDRMNFIEQSSVDAFSPNITLFHGVNSYSLDGKEYVSYGVDKSTNKAFMNVYGEMYVGDRQGGSYMRYTQENGLEISGTLSVGTKLGDTPLKDLISASSPEGYQEFVEKVTQDIEGLQNQIDGAIDSYFYQYNPTLDNYPAMDWIANGTEKAHLNDTFTNLTSGYSWRWSLDGTTYKWVEITDTATTKALAMAGKAQDTADGKRRVFVETPYPPYDKGDLWSRGSDYPLMICVNPKSLNQTYEVSDFGYADNNAKLKEEMQELVNDTKDDLNNAIGQATEAANKYADQGISAAEQALNASINALNQAKANVSEVYSKAEADGKISESETKAINAAKKQADAAIALSEITIKAYADGVVDEEEQARIKQAQENLEAAKKYADEAAQAVEDEINNNYGYLSQALNKAPQTEVKQGLVLTSLIQMRNTSSSIMSGLNGLYGAKKEKSIATWWGGDMHDLEDYYTWNGTEWVVKSNVTIPTNIPSGLIRFDGTGYLAKGKFWWDNEGKIYADPTALFLMFDVEDEAQSLSSTILAMMDKQAEFESMWSIKTDANGKKYLYSTFDLVTQGGISMYTNAEGLNLPSIYKGLPIDGQTIYWENGVLKAKGGSGIVGATTLGQLQNVGNWADSVADVDRIMYQAAGSSNWVSKNLSDLELKGDYLPLSGGTLSGSIRLNNSYLFGSVAHNTLPDKNGYLSVYHIDKATILGAYGDGTTPNIATYIRSTGDNLYHRQGNNNAYKDYRIWDEGNLTKLSQLTDDVVNGKYLPLSGGTIKTENLNGLTIKRSSSDYSVIRYMDNTELLGYIGVGSTSEIYSKQPVFIDSGIKVYKIWHSGNDGSGSGLDADFLDGNNGDFYQNRYTYKVDSNKYLKIVARDPSQLIISGSMTVGKAGLLCYYSVYGSGTDTRTRFRYIYYNLNYKVFVNKTSGARELYIYNNSAHNATINVSTLNTNAPDCEVVDALPTSYVEYGSSYELAMRSSNVASATKLETPRTIWGQSFDGSANVTGDLFLGTNKINGVDGANILNSNKDSICLGFETSKRGFPTYIDGNNIIFRYGTSNKEGMRLTSTGNVLIGTTTDDGYKLRVKGTARIDDFLYLANDINFVGSRTSTINVSANGGALSFNIGGMEFSYSKMLFTNSGNLLIGTTTDSGYKLDVNGTVNITSRGDGAELLRFNTDRAWSFIQKGAGAQASLSLQSLNANKHFYIKSNDGSSVFAFVANGANSYSISYGRINPSYDSLHDLGTSGVRWKTLYANSSVLSDRATINGIQISKSQDDVLYIDANVVVRGGITMYGTNTTSVPSILDSLPIASTTTKGIASFDSNFFSVGSDGKVTFIGQTGGGVADSVAWSGITGKPTTLNGYGITDAKISNGVITLGGSTITPLTSHQTIYNLTLQAGSFSAVTFDPNGAAKTVNIPTTTSHISEGTNLYYTDARAQAAITGGASTIKTSNLTKSRALISNSSGKVAVSAVTSTELGYLDGVTSAIQTQLNGKLSLTGGTINGSGDYLYVPLYINALNNSISGITFKTNGTEKGHVGYSSGLGIRLHSSTTAGIAVSDSNVPIFYTGDGSVKNTLWHSGNDGSGSGLDADLLDGYHVDSLLKGVYDANINFNSFSDDNNINNFYYIHEGLNQSNRPYDYGGLLQLGISTMNVQVGFDHKNAACLRTRWWSSNGYDWNSWREFAFTDSNVASATKLQTARTIWGHGFNGESGITGTVHTMTGHGVHLAVTDETGWNNRNILATSWTASTADYTEILVPSSTYNNARLRLLHNGNVGIGTPNPARKLQVMGSVSAFEDILISERTTQAGVAGGEILLSGYYAAGNMSWEARIASDYYGANFCKTAGFTHGMIFKSGRSGFDNFIFLDSSGNPVARLSSSSGEGSHHFMGNVLASGGFTMYSDQRKKTILNHVELSLKQIADAPLIEHYYNSDEKKTTHVGSIAQYWASMNDWFCKLDNEGFYTMEIQNCALASAISIARELDRYESKTDKTIKQLKKRICQLEEEVERLRAS